VNPHPRDRNLDNDLSEQLQFLTSSGSAFDLGNLSEAKRIALVIRVLVHDTSNSHSLLAQLKVKDKLDWADSAPVIDRDPNIVGRSPGLTSMGLGRDGVTFLARSADGIEQSSTTRYVSFDDWWERPVLIDSKGAEFSRRGLVLALANKDGGAHIDRLNEDTFALVHSNSAGWVRAGGGDGTAEPMPTPIYASVKTIAEELLLTLRRNGYDVPNTTTAPALGGIESFVASDYTGNPIVLEECREDVSRATFEFETLPHVTFEVTRIQQAQSDSALCISPVSPARATNRFLSTILPNNQCHRNRYRSFSTTSLRRHSTPIGQPRSRWNTITTGTTMCARQGGSIYSSP